MADTALLLVAGVALAIPGTAGAAVTSYRFVNTNPVNKFSAQLHVNSTGSTDPKDDLGVIAPGASVDMRVAGPLYAWSTLGGPFEVKTPIYVPVGSVQAGGSATVPAPALALPIFQAALARVKAGSDDCRVLCAGDSTTFGQGATTPATQGWAPQLARMINLYSGLPASPGLVACAVTGSTPDSRFGGTFGPNPFSGGFGDAGVYAVTSGNQMTFTPGYLCDTFTVWYIANNSANVIVGVVGGANAVLGSGAPAFSIQSVTYTTSPTTNPVTIFPNGAGTGGGDAIFVLAVDAHLSAQKRILVGQAGMPGTQTSGWVADGSVGGQAGNGLATIRAYAPHLTVVDLGKNDAGIGQRATAAYLADLDKIVTAAKASGDVAVRTWNPSGNPGSGNTTYEPQYVAALPAWCATRGVLLIDAYTGLYGGSYDAARSSDVLHPNSLGYDDEAQFSYNGLLPYLRYARGA